MASFNQTGQNVNVQVNTSEQPEKKFTSVRLHLSAAEKLKELSAKRKADRHTVKTAQDIVEQLIITAHKKECKS